MSLANEIRSKLKEQDWNIESGHHSYMAFSAWRQLSDVPDCQSNEKPPCICVEFYSNTEVGRLWESCEVKVAGDIGDGQWVSLSAYSINPTELMGKLSQAMSVVKACWAAACQAQAKQK